MAGNILLLLLCTVPAQLVLASLTLRQETPGDDSISYQMFHIDSLIVARYATTRITSVVMNLADSSQELNFQVQLPETAFISNFTM